MALCPTTTLPNAVCSTSVRQSWTLTNTANTRWASPCATQNRTPPASRGSAEDFPNHSDFGRRLRSRARRPLRRRLPAVRSWFGYRHPTKRRTNMKFIQLVGAAFGPRAVQLLVPAFGRPAVLNFSTSALALLSLAACGSEAQRSGSNCANVASIGPDPQATCAGSSGTDANPQGPSGGADAAAAASNNDAAAAPDGRPQ